MFFNCLYTILYRRSLTIVNGAVPLVDSFDADIFSLRNARALQPRSASLAGKGEQPKLPLTLAILTAHLYSG